MLSNVKLSRTIGKMQVFLCLMLCILTNSACQRKDLYLKVNDVNIFIDIYDVRLDLIWGVGWETEWLYQWDESITAYGVLGYTKPDYIKGTIYNVNPTTRKRFSSFTQIFNSNGGRLSLTTGATYDMLFYNFGTEWTSFNQSDDYETYTATTRTSSMSSRIRTKSESQFSNKPAGTKSYIDYNQPDELFGTLVTGLEISDNSDYYEKEVDEEGNITYIYKIDANLRPYSFIYLIQIIIKNNKESDEKGNRIVGVNGLTVTGLSQGVELFSRKTLDNTISITTEDIRPLQHHTTTDPDNPGITIDVDVLATRLLTWGLPGIDPISEWEKINANPSTTAPELDKNYIGIGFNLRNGYSWNLTTDTITAQMHEKPAGGVITVTIDATQIPQDLLDKQPTTTGGGFNASVEDWTDEVNAEVTI